MLVRSANVAYGKGKRVLRSGAPKVERSEKHGCHPTVLTETSDDHVIALPDASVAGTAPEDPVLSPLIMRWSQQVANSNTGPTPTSTSWSLAMEHDSSLPYGIE